jgi:hypothetical protein
MWAKKNPYQFLIIGRKIDILYTFHKVIIFKLMCCFSMADEIIQRAHLWLKKYSQIMLLMYLRFNILISEEIALRIRLVYWLIDIEEIVEINITKLECIVIIQVRLLLCLNALLIHKPKMQFLGTVEIYIHLTFINNNSNNCQLFIPRKHLLSRSFKFLRHYYSKIIEVFEA